MLWIEHQTSLYHKLSNAAFIPSARLLTQLKLIDQRMQHCIQINKEV